jgi:hypothetical protein
MSGGAESPEREANRNDFHRWLFFTITARKIRRPYSRSGSSYGAGTGNCKGPETARCKCPWCPFKTALKIPGFPNGESIKPIFHRKQKGGFSGVFRRGPDAKKGKRSPIRAYLT